MTRIAVLGEGSLASQIGSEFALGGCSVVWVAADAERSQQRVEEALRFASAHGLTGPVDLERARSLMTRASPGAGGEGRLTLILDALPEDLELKAEGIAALAAAHPEALVAVTAEALSVSAIGEAAGTAERTVAVRYGRPALLSPLVELLAARDTPPRLLDRVSQLLRAIGKRPVVLHREVPGMLAGRLEAALLRESAWLLERGVADAETIDEVVRDGLARLWGVAGPLRAAALRKPGELSRLAAEIGTDPAASQSLERLEREAPAEEALVELRERRDAALAAALRVDRARD